MQSKQKNAISLPSTLLVFVVISSLTTNASGVSCKDNSFTFGLISCIGDICVAERIISRKTGQLTTNLYCLIKGTNSHWREQCDGVNDKNTTVSHCCLEDDCNLQLTPRLPSEPPLSGGYTPYRPMNDIDPTVDRPTENSLTEDGPTEDGPTENSLTEDGPTEDGLTEDGPTEDGPTEDGPTEDGLTEDGLTEDGYIVCTFNVSHIFLNGHSGYCYGDRCYTERFQHNGGIEQRWGCLYKEFHDIAATCDGLRNTEGKVFKCCNSAGRCNDNLFPRLPSELVTTTTESTASTMPPSPDPTSTTPPSLGATQANTSPSSGLDLYGILTVVIVVVFVPALLCILIIGIIVTVVWKRRQDKEVRLKSGSVSSGAESPVSVESDSSASKLRHSLV